MPSGHDSSRLGSVGAVAPPWHGPLGGPFVHLCCRRVKEPQGTPSRSAFPHIQPPALRLDCLLHRVKAELVESLDPASLGDLFFGLRRPHIAGFGGRPKG